MFKFPFYHQDQQLVLLAFHQIAGTLGHGVVFGLAVSGIGQDDNG